MAIRPKKRKDIEFGQCRAGGTSSVCLFSL